MMKYIVEKFPSCIAPNKMLLSVSADVKQATTVQVKFKKWLSKMKVIGTKEDSHSRAERNQKHAVSKARQ